MLSPDESYKHGVVTISKSLTLPALFHIWKLSPLPKPPLSRDALLSYTISRGDLRFLLIKILGQRKRFKPIQGVLIGLSGPV